MFSQWKTSSSPRPKKGRQVKSNVKTVLIAFFKIDGLVHYAYIPRGQTVNKQLYKTVLHRFRDAVRRYRPEKWRSRNWIMHHDNVPANRAVTAIEFLAKHNVPSLPTPVTLLLATASCSRNWRKQWKVADSITLKRFKRTRQDKWELLQKVTTRRALVSGRNAAISAYKNKGTNLKETRPTGR